MARRPNQRQLFRELTEKFGLEVAQAFLASIDELRSGVEFQRLQAAIARGDLNAAIEALHLDRTAFQALDAALASAYVAGGNGAVQSMVSGVSVGFRFDPGNQRAAAWIREKAGRLITGLVEEQRQQAVTIIADGMAKGAGPRQVALDLVGRVSRVTGMRDGGVIGLSARQAEYLASARAELSGSDAAGLRNYLQRARRDRRFDRTVAKAIQDGKAIDSATVENMITSYSARMLAYRGEVIGRTEGIPAVRAAKREAYQQLVDDRRVAATDIERTWHTVRDGRERATHGAMNGQKVQGLDIPFVSPAGASLRYPGDTSFGAPASEIVSCRCDESIRIRPRG